MEANTTRKNLFPVFVGIAAIVAIILILYGRGII
jgi:hypothetical protein